jgi:hypothetical protein
MVSGRRTDDDQNQNPAASIPATIESHWNMTMTISPVLPCAAMFHAARAKFLGRGKQRAANRNSTGSDAYLSPANVLAVCEDE